MDALAVAANALLHVSLTYTSLALASYDVCHAFDSLIHPLMLLRAAKRGVSPAIIRSQRDMYTKLRVQRKIPLEKDELANPQDRTVPVLERASQGAIASPCYFNN